MPYDHVKHVSPNSWNPKDFEPFGKLTADEEFNLIAPLTIFHYADGRYEPKAKVAIKQLLKLEHPIVDSYSYFDLAVIAPPGLANRYNALVMAIVQDQDPLAKPEIDKYGAYEFSVNGSEIVASGDVSGFFGYFNDAKTLRESVDMANDLDPEHKPSGMRR